MSTENRNQGGRRLVMGYWDCTYCDTRGIRGTERECPSCGTPRDKDIHFYMKAGPVEYLTNEEAASKGQGQDWVCSSCGSLNSALDEVCISCGDPREKSDSTYFANREEQEEKHKVTEDFIATGGQSSNISGARAKRIYNEVGMGGSARKSPAGKIIFLLILAAVIAIFAVRAMPKSMTVTDMYWHSTQEIELYQECYEKAWELPQGGKLEHKSSEIHHYDQVLDHYETETYESYEVVGSHTEYRYEDNGDGTYSEVPYSVSDYGYVTRTRQVPIYRDVPVYKTRYYYYIWRWKYERSSEAEKHDKEPYFKKTELKDNERKGEKYVKYYVTARIKDKEAKTYETTKDIYMEISTDTSIKAKISGDQIVELK